MQILVTGGAGYIGTHTCVALLNAGHQVVVIDNYNNSHPQALKRVEAITGQSITCFEGDVGSVTVRRSSVWLTLLVETSMTRFRVAS